VPHRRLAESLENKKANEEQSRPEEEEDGMTNTDIDSNRVLYNPVDNVSPIKVEDEGEDPLPRRTGNY
jgi:hypothetical protein